MRLKDTTFILGAKPSGVSRHLMRELLWCNKVPRGKRSKVVKINGIHVGDTAAV